MLYHRSGANARPGCSLTNLGAIGTGHWGCAVGPVRGAVEPGLTCCITGRGGIRGRAIGAGVEINWVGSEDW